MDIVWGKKMLFVDRSCFCCRLKKESEVKEIIYKLLKDFRDWICFGVVMYDGFWYFMWGDYKVKVVW